MATTRIFTISVFSVVFLFQICAADRLITREILTSPDAQDPQYTIAHISAKGVTDELHYLISTLGFPTILVAYTKPSTKVNVDWDKFINETERGQSIQFTPGNVLYSYSLFFTKLIDYNDTKDYSDLTKYSPDSTKWNIYDLNQFTWESLAVSSKDMGKSVEIKATNDSVAELWQNDGKFTIKVTPFKNSGRGSTLPHLQYSENITQFDLTIDHVWTNFSKSRLALEVVMVASDDTPMAIKHTKSIDDEYTPGVFFIDNFWTKPEQNDGGFLQWKPVCYTKLSRSRGVDTFVRYYPATAVEKDTFNVMKSSLLYAVNGDAVEKMARAAANLSFGLTEDGGYNKTQIITWTASLGYGKPPADTVSTVVIIIISTGLGIPIILILFGGLFVCWKKNSKSGKNVPNGYQRINTDD